MRNLLISFSVALIVVLAYNMWGEDSPIPDDSGGKESLGSSISKSISNILPGGGEKTPEKLGRHKEGENVVVIQPSSQEIEVEDAIERIENLKDSKEHEGLDFARWTLFSENAKYTPAEKERILERASELLPMEEVSSLHRDVLYVGKEPALFEESLNFLSKSMNQAETENLIKDVLGRRQEPAMRTAIIQFAASKNIYVR